MKGGYDDGYRECACFWGYEPGSYVKLLSEQVPSLMGLNVLDAGCGEGKNASFLAGRGGIVEAVDVSELALQNGRRCWNGKIPMTWRLGDMRHIKFLRDNYDIVIAYGLLHCLSSIPELRMVLGRLQAVTGPAGFNVICAFNDRHQELHAHPGFQPSLMSHTDYLELYASGWQVISASDSDLVERHPHNQIEHTHSMTRILARRAV